MNITQSQQSQSFVMYNQTTRPLYVLFVFGTLGLLTVASVVAFLRLHIQRRRRIVDSTPKPRYRRHHRLWILAAGTARRPQQMVELQTISQRGADTNALILPQQSPPEPDGPTVPDRNNSPA